VKQFAPPGRSAIRTRCALTLVSLLSNFSTQEVGQP
jgi:hypothetical protein